MDQKQLSTEIIAISNKSEKAINKQLTDLGVTFDLELSLNEKKELLIKRILQNEAVVALKEEITDEEQLKQTAAKIIAEATTHNEAIKSFETPEEVDAYLTNLEELIGAKATSYFKDAFPTIREKRGAVLPANDLPASDIISNLPIRVIEQAIAKIALSYPLIDLVTKETVRNGIKQIFFQDYRDTDNKSGFSDVEMSDYNPGSEPVFGETYPANTEVHKGYAILSSVLNDVTVTPGLFVSLINNYVYAIARPIAKTMYKRFVAWLDLDTDHDLVKAFDAATIEEQAKELSNLITSLQTPSRTHLKRKPEGSAKILEFSAKPEELVMIFNNKFSTKYNYDLAAKTFQLGKITYAVSDIKVVDFDKVKEYTADEAASKINEIEVIIYQKGKYNEIFHYDASKGVDTPKLKSVFHRYIRVGNYSLKNKYSAKLKTKTV